MNERKLDLGIEYLADSPPTVLRHDTLTDWLNGKAAEGWRLISVDAGCYYFERQARKLRTSPPKSDRPNPA